MNSGIYKIVNVINGHKYVGSAVDIENRWSSHKHDLRNNEHHSRYLQRAWNKYGEDAFEFEVLEHCFQFILTLREQHYMDTLNPEYNISPKAGSCLGVKHSDEVRKRMSEAGKKYYSENPMTQEARIKNSEAVKKAKESPEVRARMSEAMKTVWANPEIREKILTAVKNRLTDPEIRAKISSGLMQRWKSPEARARHSEAMKKHHAENPATLEARIKASEKQKKVWELRKQKEK